MIFEGLKLTLLGMGVVFAFLGLLVVVIRLIARVLKPLTDRELSAQRGLVPTRKSPRHHQELEEKRRILAVISAAITAHRSRAVTAHAIATPPMANHPGGAVWEQSRHHRAAVDPVRRAPGLTRLLVRDPAARLHLQWLRQYKHNQ